MMEAKSCDAEIDPQEPILECGTSLAEHEHYQCAQEEPNPTTTQNGKDETVESLRNLLASDVLTGGQGPFTMFASPFEVPRGSRINVPMVYCDQTASNRPLKSIERYMERVCLPLYGNTHTISSITGSQR